MFARLRVLIVVVSTGLLVACSGGSGTPPDEAPDAGPLDPMTPDAAPDAAPDAPPDGPLDPTCVTETCNGADDDCDGAIDEELGVGEACSAGQGGCERTGAIVCAADGTPTCNAIAGTPADEACNGIDDDCDGAVDDVDVLGTACDSGEPGVCAPGTWVCVPGGGLACASLAPATAEACNTLDDDCDGSSDEGNPGGGLICATGGLGICGVGTTRCDAGGIVCDQAATASAEICNQLDDDCDGSADDACLPATPTVRAPWSGYQTGSLWAEGAVGVVTSPLRPTFRWSASAGATSYRLEIDDSCTAVAGCAFPSPEVDLELTAADYTPPAALPVSQVAPVGRRYYFRIRACNTEGCSPPTAVHYVDVGRVDGDVDGDGYPDLLVNASLANKAYLFRGSSAGLVTSPATTLVSYTAEGAVFAGDLDGDGFGDVVMGNWKASTYQGVAHVYRGSATGLETSPSQTIASPIRGTYVFFGNARGAGDVDGDGFADLVIGAPGAGETGTAFVYFGSPAGVDLDSFVEIPTPMGGADGFFGDNVAGVGDVDADGLADFAISDPDRLRDGVEAGAVAVYRGDLAGPPTTPAIILENPDHPSRRWFGGHVDAAGDVDGDGYADLMTAPRTGRVGTPYPNVLFVYRGGPGGLDATPDIGIHSPLSATDTAFAADLAGGGDVDGDGRSDLLVGDWLAVTQQSGLAYLFGGAATTATRTFAPPSVQHTGHFGAATAVCDLDSDGHGDVVIGQLHYGTPATGAIFVYPGSASGPASEPTLTVTDPDGADTYFGVHAACRR